MRHLIKSDLRYPSLWRNCVLAWNPGLGPTGSTLVDRTGRGKNLTLVNATPDTAWGIDRGYVVSTLVGTSTASDDHWSGTDNISLGSGLTISMWVNITSHGAWASLVKKGDGVNTGLWDWSIVFNGSNDNVYLIRNGANTSSTSTSIPIGVFTHVGAVISDSKTELWLNGIRVDSGSGVGTGATTNTSTRYVNVFSHPSSPNSGITGSFTDIRIFDGDFGSLLPLLSRRPSIAYETARRSRYGSTAATSTTFRRTLNARIGSRGIQ